MSYVPTVAEAKELVMKYNKEAFHIQHAETVSKVMGEFAKEFDPENVDFWAAVGMIHDIDFELYPEQHCVKANEMLHELDIDEDFIHAVVSHGYGICADVEPVKYMEKVLFAVDELTGLIGAAALMRPTGISDMETKSVVKKIRNLLPAAQETLSVKAARCLAWSSMSLFPELLKQCAADDKSFLYAAYRPSYKLGRSAAF